MRWSLFSALLVAAGAGMGFTNVQALDRTCTTAAGSCCQDTGCCQSEGCQSDCCDSGCGECGKCKGDHSRGYEGLDRHFNCGCNGSYKFPVPPLYTYHWPGLYSQQLVTDYHSPWRFPPLKPYSDERLKPYPSGRSSPSPAPSNRDNEDLPPAAPSMTGTNSMPPSDVQAAEYATSAKVLPGSAESMSDKLKRTSRYAQ